MPPETPLPLLLLVGCDPSLTRLAEIVGRRAGWRNRAVANSAEAAVLVAQGADPAAILLALGQEPARAATLRASAPEVHLIAAGDAALQTDALRGGASDFLALPSPPDMLLDALKAARDRRRPKDELQPLSGKRVRTIRFDELIGSAPAFRTALALAAKAARARSPLLIEGEEGTGKETLARAVHGAGPRATGPFVAVDCRAIPSNLIESVLFGHEKGAFPGAFERQTGRLAEADGGTLFLAGIDDLPFPVQARLLDAITTGEVRPIGAVGFRAVDMRVIAAASRPLEEEAASGRFREDLYHRIASVKAVMPPLRERRGDIAALARHILARMARQLQVKPLTIADDAIAVLLSYGWPGNVRQLETTLYRASLRCEGNALTAADLPRVAEAASFSRRAGDVGLTPVPTPAVSGVAPAPGIQLYRQDGHLRTMDEIEADLIRLAIGHYGGRMSEVARRLGIGRSTLYRRLAELGISDAAA